jgi:hypothetical protein
MESAGPSETSIYKAIPRHIPEDGSLTKDVQNVTFPNTCRYMRIHHNVNRSQLIPLKYRYYSTQSQSTLMQLFHVGTSLKISSRQNSNGWNCNHSRTAISTAPLLWNVREKDGTNPLICSGIVLKNNGTSVTMSYNYCSKDSSFNFYDLGKLTYWTSS